jgi:hypothetical protein
MAPRLLAALALALASIASTIQAQDRWGFDLRGGFAVATQDPTNVSLDRIRFRRDSRLPPAAASVSVHRLGSAPFHG